MLSTVPTCPAQIFNFTAIIVAPRSFDTMRSLPTLGNYYGTILANAAVDHSLLSNVQDSDLYGGITTE